MKPGDLVMIYPSRRRGWLLDKNTLDWTLDPGLCLIVLDLPHRPTMCWYEDQTRVMTVPELIGDLA